MVDGCGLHAGLVAQAGQFGPNIDSHLALFCIHRVNRVKP